MEYKDVMKRCNTKILNTKMPYKDAKMHVAYYMYIGEKSPSFTNCSLLAKRAGWLTIDQAGWLVHAVHILTQWPGSQPKDSICVGWPHDNSQAPYRTNTCIHVPDLCCEQ